MRYKVAEVKRNLGEKTKIIVSEKPKKMIN